MTMIKIARDGHCSLAHPMAEPGPTSSGAIIFAVDDVPDVVTSREVVELFAGTVIWTAGVYRVRFAELGPGRLVRQAAN